MNENEEERFFNEVMREQWEQEMLTPSDTQTAYNRFNADFERVFNVVTKENKDAMV